MSDQRDGQDTRMRQQWERQYEIDRITFEYASEQRAGRAPRIDEYVRRYPQYTRELMEYALYFHTVGADLDPFEEPADLTLSPAGEKALAWVHEQLATYSSTSSTSSTSSASSASSASSVAIESLVKQGIQVGYTPPQLAEAVGLTAALLARLEARKITLTSIPRTLLQRLGDRLQVSAESIAAYLGGAHIGEAGGFYYADQPPEQQLQEPFLDAIEASSLAPDRKQEWADIVRQDLGDSA